MRKLENFCEMSDDSILDYSSVIDDYLLSLREVEVDDFNKIKKIPDKISFEKII